MTLVITVRQQAALDFIARYLAEHRRPPSYREIAQAMGVKSLNTVHGYLMALEVRGLIKRSGESSWRSWQVTSAAQVLL